ncbi:MAG TPA: recombinase family protein [Solirubrobacterales bacterium]|jgi:DNA invertase Pin-like site-specific DNA recombinase|nr:recombinase family protein [Solirubrobacterales bacterium]
MSEVSGAVVAYRRVSTREQADSGLGLAAQRKRLQAEAERRGWADVRWVTDEAVSGSVDAAQRPGLGPALEAMRPGDVLAMSKLDRLSRSTADFAGLVRRSREEGWSLVCLDPVLDLTTATGRAMAGLVVVFAEWERETIGQRVREGLAQTDKRVGRPLGLPPVGAAARGPEPVPPRVAAVVRDALGAGLSPGATADRLNGYGIPSLRGGRWHRESVRRLLPRLVA